MTAEHPFLTAEGWKALDPEATRRENAAAGGGGAAAGRPALPRRRVRVVGGERRSAPAGRRRPVPAAHDDAGGAGRDRAPAADTPLFNLLLDGDHSYVADGWIVHNKEGDAIADGGCGTFRVSTTAVDPVRPSERPRAAGSDQHVRLTSRNLRRHAASREADAAIAG